MTTPTGSGADRPAPSPIVSWEAPVEDAGPAPGVKFASHGARFVAYIIDTLIASAIMVVLAIPLFAIVAGEARSGDVQSPGLSAAGAGASIFGFLLILVVAVAYFPFFWARSGQTPGMRPFGLYVVRDRDGTKISAGQAIVRLVGMWISAIPFYIGYIWVFIDSRHRGWHDLMAGTVMVERTKP